MSNGIPTRLGMNLSGLTPGGKFISLLQGQPFGAPRPAARTARGNVVPVLPGTPPYARPATKPAMPLEQAVMAQSMAQPKTSAPMTKLQRDLAMKMGLTGATQQQKDPAGGIMGMLPGIDTPGGAGLSAAAARGLQLSGYQDRPITTGQVLGEMMGAGMEAYREAKAAQRPEIKVAGDKVFRIYPDGRTELLSGSEAKEPAEVKGEAGRIMIDGRMTQGVYDKYGNLYEIGNMSEPLNPQDVQFIDAFSSQNVQQLQSFRENNIKSKEKTLKYVDTLAAQINASPSGWAERQKARVSIALKRLAGNTDYSEQELAMALSNGTLTALVGASRLEIFGPGVLTESEQAMAREVFVGNFDNLNRTEALARLKNFRDMTLQGYVEDIGIYNASPAASIKYVPYYEKNQIFDWEGQYGSQADVSVQQGPTSKQSGSTSGGNSWSVMR